MLEENPTLLDPPVDVPAPWLVAALLVAPLLVAALLVAAKLLAPPLDGGRDVAAADVPTLVLVVPRELDVFCALDAAEEPAPPLDEPEDASPEDEPPDPVEHAPSHNKAITTAAFFMTPEWLNVHALSIHLLSALGVRV